MEDKQKDKKDLEAAKGWLAIAKEKGNNLCVQILEDLFPELRKSEDERIRNFLIKQANSVLESITDDDEEVPAWKSALAWLEKQGEQKPTWSEEDSKNLNSVKWIIENSENLNRVFETIDSPKYIKKYFIDWLKSLEDRFQLQPKQEWSEKDEGFLNLLLAIFTNEHPNGVFTTDNITVFKGNCVTSNRIIAWLKSLEPNHWKPSEEQLEALKHYVDTTMDGEIELLYNDLTKL